ncbi:MAG TPA: hypothetical protein VN851_20325 [Thermoanaerobaculia bacterium]|nr:hypothetical protein [Thermoanaerobaculia bacterium]
MDRPCGFARPGARYDGDGKADRSTYLAGAWHFYNTDGSYNKGIWVGNIAGLVPVPGDYVGNGIEAPVVFYTGAWVRYDFTTGAIAASVYTGPPTGSPAPLDYDGDGTLDFSVYDNGPWHFYNDNGTYRGGVFTGGGSNDKPISRRSLQ